MNKETIAGYPALNFGSNNYSFDMEAIIFNPKDISWQEVAKLPGIFLHPTEEPNSLEIFTLKGSEEQFKLFKRDAVRAFASKKAIKDIGFPEPDDRDSWNRVSELIDVTVSTFIPWYER